MVFQNTRHPNIIQLLDERKQGMGFVAQLKPGKRFVLSNIAVVAHERTFDTIKDAEAAADEAIECNCKDCLKFV